MTAVAQAEPAGSSAEQRVDVAIIGGGIVGLTLAHLLLAVRRANAPLTLAVVEPRPPELDPDVTAQIDIRVSALAPRAQRMYAELGVWAQLPAEKCCAYEHMRVWQGADGSGGSRAISFAAAALGVPQLGHIVENKALRAVLWRQLAASSRCRLLTAGPAQRLAPGRDAVMIDLTEQQLQASLVVAADGANSRARGQLGVSHAEQSYEQHGIVAHIATERAHSGTAWQKFLPDGPVALLPLANGLSSLVWSVSTASKERYLQLDDAAFAAELSAALGDEFGALRCASPRAAFPLARAHAERYTGRRFALLGDAAHRVHPLAGQGLNLGLYDAQVLAEELATHLRRRAADPGDPVALRRYERRRKGDNLLTLRAMDALNGVFRSRFAATAGAGLQVLDRQSYVKRLLARHAMGLR